MVSEQRTLLALILDEISDMPWVIPVCSVETSQHRTNMHAGKACKLSLHPKRAWYCKVRGMTADVGEIASVHILHAHLCQAS